MLTFLIIAGNVVVMGFLVLCAIWDDPNDIRPFKKLGPRELIWFFIAVWILGCATGLIQGA